MNISSFHTHTRLCRHASGDPADYVRHAVSGGCSALGFSDHCPYPDDSLWTGSRMSIAWLPQYLEMVKAAKATAPFPLFWGFECEWHPAYESWYRDFIRAELGSEYLVYGAHWVPDNGDFWYIPDYPEKRILRTYADLTIQGLGTGLYDLFAHPDLLLYGFSMSDPDVRNACIDIIDAAVAAGLPMEINGSGLSKTFVRDGASLRAPYPVREFWEIAAERGALIVCNSDAHRPEDVLAGARAAKEFADSLGIATVDTAVALGFVKQS